MFTAYLGGWGAGLASGCIVVCSKNYVYDGKICQPCATLFASQIDLKYYSFWNASDSARWWPAESDSLFGLTTRRTSGLEHRVSVQQCKNGVSMDELTFLPLFFGSRLAFVGLVPNLSTACMTSVIKMSPSL